MNVLDLKTWSERQQILAVILAAGVLIFTVWYFALYPKNKKRKALENEIKSKKNEFAKMRLPFDEEALKKRRQDWQDHRDALEKEWSRTAGRLAAFQDQKRLAKDRVGKIDFKVALINVRHRLQQKSADLGIRLPHDLGMDVSVHSNEDERKLMLQLRAVEKLADLALNLKIKMLGQIEPLKPVLHEVKEVGESYLEEYPVRMEFYGSLENTYDLFAAVLESRHVFFLKNFRIEAASKENPGLLRVNATLSVLLFYKDPSDLPHVRRKSLWKPGRMGH